MRAILINAFEQKVEEIDLPSEFSSFQTKVRELLRANSFTFFPHEDKTSTLLVDENCLLKDSPAFFAGLMKQWPLFGNVIWLGQDPISGDKRDLFHALKPETLDIRWCSPQESKKYRDQGKRFAQNLQKGK